MEGWIDPDLLAKVWEQDPAPYGPPPPDMYNYEDPEWGAGAITMFRIF